MVVKLLGPHQLRYEIWIHANLEHEIARRVKDHDDDDLLFSWFSDETELRFIIRCRIKKEIYPAVDSIHEQVFNIGYEIDSKECKYVNGIIRQNQKMMNEIILG